MQRLHICLTDLVKIDLSVAILVEKCDKFLRIVDIESRVANWSRQDLRELHTLVINGKSTT